MSILTKSIAKTFRNNAQCNCSVLWRRHIAFSAHVLATYITKNSLKWVRHTGGVPRKLYRVPAKCHTTWKMLKSKACFPVKDRGYVSERVIFNRKLGHHDRFGRLRVNEGLRYFGRNRVGSVLWPSHWCYSTSNCGLQSACRGKANTLICSGRKSIPYHWTENKRVESSFLPSARTRRGTQLTISCWTTK